MKDLIGKTAVITGASRGIGAATATAFAAAGANICLLARSETQIIELAKNIGPRAMARACDVADYAAVDAAIRAAQAAFGSVDILINNASLFEDDAPFGPQSFGQFMQSFQVHMAFPALLSQWFAQQHDQDLRAESGLIINMSDIYAANPMPDRAYYSATKAGLESLTLSYAKSLAPAIRVNSIQPGAISFLPEYSEDAKTPVLQGSLIAKTGGFGALLKAVDYLCNNEFVTATALKVDGGRSVAR